MTRAAIYVRVSTADQAERSIPAQEAACRAWADEHGHEVVAVFRDEGVSAWSGKTRPGYEAAKDAAESGEFDVLVVDSYDRLSRGADQESVLGACWAFKSLGVEVASASEHTPTDAALASMMRLMHSITANQESERKSARSKRGAEGRAAKGAHVGRTPFGYAAVSGGLEPDPVTSPALRSIFEDYANGASQQAIARRLEAEGVPTASGGRWHQGTVRVILANPVYLGLVKFHDEYKPGSHEPLVSEELFDRCKARLTSRGPRERRGRDAQSHVLSRLLKCGVCGETLMARRGEVRPQKGGRYETYVCPNSAGRFGGSCDLPPVPRSAIDAAVMDHFTRTVIDVDATKVAWAKQHSAAVERAEGEVTAAEVVARRADEAYERTERDYLSGELPVTLWAKVEPKLDADREGARTAVEAARRRLDEARAVPEPDVEARVAEALTGLHEAVARGLDDADNVAAVRARLGETFDCFTVYPDVGQDTDPMGETEHEHAVKPTGFVVWPELRGELFDIVGYDEFGTPIHEKPVIKRIPLPVQKYAQGLVSPFIWPHAIVLNGAA